MRHLQKLHEKYRGKGLVILGFNCSDDKKIAVEFLRDSKATFPTILDSSDAASKVQFRDYKATGVPLNFNWIDYRMPTMADCPDVDPVLLEVWQGAGEYGACGIGESVTTCTPRAVANAIYNAIGVRVDSLPITPNKVLQALAGAHAAASPEKAR